MVDGKPGVFIASGYSSYLYTREVKNWRDQEMFKFDDANVTQLTIDKKGSVFSFTKADKWAGTFKGTAIADMDEEKVKDAVRAFKSLNADDFGDGKAAADTGLDAPESIVTIALKETTTDAGVTPPQKLTLKGRQDLDRLKPLRAKRRRPDDLHHRLLRRRLGDRRAPQVPEGQGRRRRTRQGRREGAADGYAHGHARHAPGHASGPPEPLGRRARRHYVPLCCYAAHAGVHGRGSVHAPSSSHEDLIRATAVAPGGV